MRSYLLYIYLFTLAACSSNDKTRPEIALISPVDSQRIINADTIWVQAVFTDNESLGQSRYQISPAFAVAAYDTLVPGWFVPVSLLRIYTLKGTKADELTPLDLDTSYMPGWYTLKISCADLRGNEAIQTEKVRLIRPEDTLSPQATWILPATGTVSGIADSVFYQFQVQDFMSDNTPGSLLEIRVVIRDASGSRNTLLEQYVRTGSGQYSFREKLPSGWPAGEYTAIIRMRDRYNNRDSLLIPLSFQ